MAARISLTRSSQLLSACRSGAVRRAQPTIVRHQFPQRSFTASAIREVKAYTEDHEWIELSEDKKTCTIGISKYAANALGDVTYAELPEVGTEVGSGDAVGAVESVKSASDVLTPIEGTVVEANEILTEKPTLLNQDPEGEGWVCKIEVKNTSALDGLMDAAAYKKFTEEHSE